MEEGKASKAFSKVRQIAGKVAMGLATFAGWAGLGIHTLFIIGIIFLGWGWDLLFCACIWLSALQRAMRWGK